jgi:hypothetical protein
MDNMKGNLKKFVFVLSAISITTLSYADNNHRSSGWDLNFGLEYSQFSNNGTQYATNFLGKSYNIDPHYHTGYNLGFGYNVPGKDSDLDFEYSHFQGNNKATAWSASPDSPDLFVGALGIGGPFSYAQSKVSYGLDSFDVTAGHKIKLTPTFDVNLTGGLNYTHLTKDISTYGSDPMVGTTFQEDLGTSFNGFGPVFEADGECYPFDFAPGFDVFGGVRAAAPYGRMTSYLRDSGDAEIAFNNEIPNEKLVVPSVGAKIGVEYNFNNYKGVTVGAQIGYQGTEYFNATKDFFLVGNTASNLSYQGWFGNIDMRF